MKRISITILFLMIISSFVYAKQYYASNFENDALGNPPKGWELGFKGAGNAKVIVDPLNPNNKIFAHTDLAKDKARHDVGGNIWVVGPADLKDFIIEYDAYFPEDFYIGVLFRFVSSDEFYLLDRRSGGEAGNFDFWKRGGGNWTRFGTGKFDAQPKKWYSFRIVGKGDSFEAYAKAKDDKTPFDNLKPILSGKEATYKAGKFGLYGLIYIDNLIIGETASDMVLTAVRPAGKLPIAWGDMKSK